MNEQNIYSYHFSDEGRMCFVKGEGVTNFDQTIKLIDLVLADPHYTINTSIIIDVRKVVYHPSYSDIIGINEHLKGLKEKLKGRFAILPNYTIYHIVIIIERIVNKVGINLKFFKDYDKATEWINNDVVD